MVETLTTVTVTTKTAMSDSEKYCFDMRLNKRGHQQSPRVRVYESPHGPQYLEDAAADIRRQFRAKVQLSGGHFE